ncbi:MAG: DUF1629 domain-containing protein [Hyphomicrobiaceae bacterium]
MIHYRIAPPLNSGKPLPRVQWVRDPSGTRVIYSALAFHRKDEPLSNDEISRFNNCVEFSLKPSNGPLDFVCAPMSREYLVSHRIRSSIDDLEPGKHQFIAMSLIMPDAWRNILEDTRYYWLNCCTRLEAIDIPRSDLVSPVPGSPYLGPAQDDSEIAIIKRIVRDHHLWMSIVTVAGGHTFVSEALAEKWRAMDAGPIELLPCIMV